MELIMGKPQPNATKYDEFMRNEIRQTLRDRQMENLQLDYEPKAIPQVRFPITFRLDSPQR